MTKTHGFEFNFFFRNICLCLRCGALQPERVSYFILCDLIWFTNDIDIDDVCCDAPETMEIFFMLCLKVQILYRVS